jgi:hypothetical protein
MGISILKNILMIIFQKFDLIYTLEIYILILLKEFSSLHIFNHFFYFICFFEEFFLNIYFCCNLVFSLFSKDFFFNYINYNFKVFIFLYLINLFNFCVNLKFYFYFRKFFIKLFIFF